MARLRAAAQKTAVETQQRAVAAQPQHHSRKKRLMRTKSGSKSLRSCAVKQTNSVT
jgi:hypothetical protein